MPQEFMRLPARMNSGMASIVKLWEVEMDFCTSTVMGRSRTRKKVKPERPMEKATGMPVSSRTRKTTIAIYIIRCPSLSRW